MPKRKLTDKLKAEIKANPYRLRKADFSGDALAYLNRIRGARKAVKTKILKAKYKAPKRKREGAPAQVSDLIAVAAKAKGMSVKQFRKKYPKDIADFEKTFRLYYNREVDQLQLDIKFLPKGRSVIMNKSRTTRPKAIFTLSFMKHKAMATGLIYERVNIEHSYDATGNLHFECPTSSNMAGLEDEELLDFIQDNYPISFYRK